MSSAATAFSIVLQPSGWRFDAAADTPLVRAAALADIRLPSACRNGTCRACMCRLLAGEVAYPGARPGLTDDERSEGWILPCVAHAVSPLELDVPHAAVLQRRPPSTLLTGARR